MCMYMICTYNFIFVSRCRFILDALLYLRFHILLFSVNLSELSGTFTNSFIMPQLDTFFFFSVFSSFSFFFAGMFVFCSYIVPFFMYMAKLVSSRISCYYLTLLDIEYSRIRLAHFYYFQILIKITVVAIFVIMCLYFSDMYYTLHAEEHLSGSVKQCLYNTRYSYHKSQHDARSYLINYIDGTRQKYAVKIDMNYDLKMLGSTSFIDVPNVANCVFTPVSGTDIRYSPVLEKLVTDMSRDELSVHYLLVCSSNMFEYSNSITCLLQFYGSYLSSEDVLFWTKINKELLATLDESRAIVNE